MPGVSGLESKRAAVLSTRLAARRGKTGNVSAPWIRGSAPLPRILCQYSGVLPEGSGWPCRHARVRVMGGVRRTTDYPIMLVLYSPCNTATPKLQVCCGIEHAASRADRKFASSSHCCRLVRRITCRLIVLTYAADARDPHGHLPPLLPPSRLPACRAPSPGSRTAMLLSSPLVTLPVSRRRTSRLPQQRARWHLPPPARLLPVVTLCG
eukprot:scaffold64618_cov54-Phaeocystis_antarctica.AAC.8